MVDLLILRLEKQGYPKATVSRNVAEYKHNKCKRERRVHVLQRRFIMA